MGHAVILDINRFHHYTDETPENQKAMANLFIDQAHAYLDELIIAFEHDSINEWHDVSHKFKGMALFAGAMLLAESCTEAQNQYQSPAEQKKALLEAIIHNTKNTIQIFEDSILKD